MVQLYGRQWTQRELLRHVGHVDQVAGIKLVEAGDGRGRGARLFDVWTGTGLTFQVSAERALDITACHYKGMSLAWQSSTGDVHPAYFEPEGLGWLRSFQAGLLTTCGLDQFGSPATDAGEEFGQHGRISNLPARYVGHRAYWQDDEYELEITGEIRQTNVFAENLVLRRRITTRLGSNQIRIEDTVSNEAFTPQPHMILYHFNLGFPLLSADTRLHADVEKTVPRDKDAEAGLGNWSRFQPPTPAFAPQVFRHDVKADANGMVQVELRNPTLALTFRLRYAKASLPHLFQWKMMSEGVYVCGIEPGNSSAIEGRTVARQRNDLPHLAPGETRSYALEIEIAE